MLPFRGLDDDGRFTHVSGHPSAAGRAQDRESSPVKDRRSTNCATQPAADLAESNVTNLSLRVLLYDGPLICGFNVTIKGLKLTPGNLFIM